MSQPQFLWAALALFHEYPRLLIRSEPPVQPQIPVRGGKYSDLQSGQAIRGGLLILLQFVTKRSQLGKGFGILVAERGHPLFGGAYLPQFGALGSGIGR